MSWDNIMYLVIDEPKVMDGMGEVVPPNEHIMEIKLHPHLPNQTLGWLILCVTKKVP